MAYSTFLCNQSHFTTKQTTCLLEVLNQTNPFLSIKTIQLALLCGDSLPYTVGETSIELINPFPVNMFPITLFK